MEMLLPAWIFLRGRRTSSFSLALDFVIVVVVYFILFYNINKIYLFSKNLWQPHGSSVFGVVSLSLPPYESSWI